MDFALNKFTYDLLGNCELKLSSGSGLKGVEVERGADNLWVQASGLALRCGPLAAEVRASVYFLLFSVLMCILQIRIAATARQNF